MSKRKKKRQENDEENKKLNLLPDQLLTWNLDHSSEVDDNEWKCEIKKKKTRKGREKDEENEKDENEKTN